MYLSMFSDESLDQFMDMKIKREFIALWKKYFNNPELPITFYYTDEEVVIFFAKPDVLSGLFTLAGFDTAEPNGVISSFGSGCGAIVQYPYLEKDSGNPRAVLGMFDVSARPYVREDELTLAVPMKKFVTMVGNMEESFLITGSW